MATFRDCLISAVEQGAISKEAAADLDARFQEKWSQARLSLGDEAAGAAAKAALEAELRFESIELRRQAALTKGAQDRLKTELTGYRDVSGRPDMFSATLAQFESFGEGVFSIKERGKAIISLAHGELADVLQAFRRTFISGKRMNKVLADDVARELHGEGSGSVQAKAFADAISSIFEALRTRFNAAGGNIAKLENYMPHAHDSAAIHKAGFDDWLKFIKPRLDFEKMRDPLTGDALGASRLNQVLHGAYDNITTNGWKNRDPSMQSFGKGALANQRQEHRFLVFKSADAWLEYDRQFGKGDPVVSIFQHINSMAKDIATMEVLGPNPGAMVEWLKQMNAREFARHKAGEPSLYREVERMPIPGLDQLPSILPEGKIKAAIEGRRSLAESVGGSPEYLMRRIDQVYRYQRGRATLSDGVANVAGATRNMITSAVLASGAVTAAVTDPFIDAIARKVSGLPIMPAFTAIAKTFSSQTEAQALRSGIIMDDFIHIFRDETRYTTLSMQGSETSRWLADRSLMWTGLTPMTEARRHVLALDWQAAVADHAKLSFDLLPDRLRSTMEGYGIIARDWDSMRHTPAHIPAEGSAGLIRPIDIAKYDREAAERFLGLIYGQTERHVPTGTIRSRSMLLQGADRGSVPGELLEGMLQFKSFGLSFTTLQLQAFHQEMARGKWQGAAYAGAGLLALTLGGAMAIQLGNTFQGKDPQPMNDPNFILAAIQRGGGFGLFGDFMFSDVNRLGGGWEKTLAGPTSGLVSDVARLTVGNARDLLRSKDTHAGREGVNLLRHYTPILSSAWPIRASYNRVLLDQLQYLLDPEAHKSFRQQEQRFQNETGGTMYWPPGEIAPRRPPTLDRLMK